MLKFFLGVVAGALCLALAVPAARVYVVLAMAGLLVVAFVVAFVVASAPHLVGAFAFTFAKPRQSSPKRAPHAVKAATSWTEAPRVNYDAFEVPTYLRKGYDRRAI